MTTILQQPADPESMARHAGRAMYGSRVGILRRVELYRLGNAWGFKFPVGATKEYMLPFFQKLEMEGKDPLRPPNNANIDVLVKERECEFAAETHAAIAVDEEITAKEAPKEIVAPRTKSEFETKLETLQHWELKKFCREKGIPQTNKDRKQDLIARIVAASEGNLEQDTSSGC